MASASVAASEKGMWAYIFICSGLVRGENQAVGYIWRHGPGAAVDPLPIAGDGRSLTQDGDDDSHLIGLASITAAAMVHPSLLLSFCLRPRTRFRDDHSRVALALPPPPPPLSSLPLSCLITRPKYPLTKRSPPPTDSSPTSPPPSSTSSAAHLTPPPTQPHGHPHLSLTIDTPPSASPFPSPSSSFLPPPIPGAHEFAMKPPPAGNGVTSLRRGSALASSVTNGGNGNGGSGHRKTNSSDASAPATADPATPRANSAGGLGGISAGVFSALMSGVNPFASSRDKDKEKSSAGAAAVSPASSNPSPATPTPASTAAANASASAAASSSSSSSTGSSASSTGIQAQAQAQTPTTATTAKRVSFPLPPQPTTPTTPTSATTTSSSSSHHDGPTPSSSRPAPPSPALSRRTSMAREERRLSGHGHGHAHHSPRGSLQLGQLTRSASNGSAHGGGVASRRTSRTLHRLSQSVSAADVEGDEAFVDAATSPPPPETEVEASAPAPASSTSTSAPVASTTSSTSAPASGDTKRVPITIRDFAFPPADERYAGLGPDVPPPCQPSRLARRLRGEVRLSDYGVREEEDDDDDGGVNGWGGSGFAWGRGRMEVASAGDENGKGRDGVGAADFARNFGNVDDDSEDDEGGLLYADEDGYDDDDLYYAETYADVPPGLYRAQFAFSALDGAEMGLVEGQLIHVLGSTDAGGEGEGEPAAAGWAVAREREPPLVLPGADVLEVNAMVGARTDAGRVWAEMWAAEAGAGANADGAGERERRALVPDSYIVLIRGEGEREADAHVRLVRYLEWLEKERVRQEEEAREAAAAEDDDEDGEEGVFEDARGE
ncbi:hypothetical protein C8R46DRAFT_1276040 [Mycena filopes]|nr:hypothetical protein C8R46DRAFT_1276040 [Mycena filopes]